VSAATGEKGQAVNQGRPPIPDGFGLRFRTALFALRPPAQTIRLAWVLLDQAYRQRSRVVIVPQASLRADAELSSGWSLDRASDWLVERELLAVEVAGAGRGSRSFYELREPGGNTPPRTGDSTGVETPSETPSETPRPWGGVLHPLPYPHPAGPAEKLIDEEAAGRPRPAAGVDARLELALTRLAAAPGGAPVNDTGRGLFEQAYAENPEGTLREIDAAITDAEQRKVFKPVGAVLGRLKKGRHRHRDRDRRGAHRRRAAPPCPECGIGGGRHAADCPAQAAE
jgi:hypothetical protein